MPLKVIQNAKVTNVVRRPFGHESYRVILEYLGATGIAKVETVDLFVLKAEILSEEFEDEEESSMDLSLPSLSLSTIRLDFLWGFDELLECLRS